MPAPPAITSTAPCPEVTVRSSTATARRNSAVRPRNSGSFKSPHDIRPVLMPDANRSRSGPNTIVLQMPSRTRTCRNRSGHTFRTGAPESTQSTDLQRLISNRVSVARITASPAEGRWFDTSRDHYQTPVHGRELPLSRSIRHSVRSISGQTADPIRRKITEDLEASRRERRAPRRRPIRRRTDRRRCAQSP